MITNTEHLRSLYKRKKFINVIKEFKKVSLKNRTSEMYVLMAKSLQLIDEKSYKLTDISKYLKQAIKVDSHNIDAYVELAYFYLNVIDDVKKAKAYFELAIKIIQENFLEVLYGYQGDDKLKKNLEKEKRKHILAINSIK